MKKSFVLMLSLVILSALSVSALADSSLLIGSDLPSGWYFLPDGVTVSVPDDVDAPSALSGAVSFTANPGRYDVGSDIPAGAYSVRCADGVELTTVAFYNEDGDWFLLESLESEAGEVVGKVELIDGYMVEVRNGDAYFSAPSGISFD